MKRILTMIAVVAMLQACGGSGEGGTINDGFDGAGDANGALQDTGNVVNDPGMDTARGEDRVDLQQRNQGDTSTPR